MKGKLILAIIGLLFSAILVSAGRPPKTPEASIPYDDGFSADVPSCGPWIPMPGAIPAYDIPTGKCGDLQIWTSSGRQTLGALLGYPGYKGTTANNLLVSVTRGPNDTGESFAIGVEYSRKKDDYDCPAEESFPWEWCYIYPPLDTCIVDLQDIPDWTYCRIDLSSSVHRRPSGFEERLHLTGLSITEVPTTFTLTSVYRGAFSRTDSDCGPWMPNGVTLGSSCGNAIFTRNSSMHHDLSHTTMPGKALQVALSGYGTYQLQLVQNPASTECTIEASGLCYLKAAGFNRIVITSPSGGTLEQLVIREVDLVKAYLPLISREY